MSVNEKMTAIAEAIRDKTGNTELLTLDDMAAEVPEVYNAGLAEAERFFWDTLQQNGNRKTYGYTFAYLHFTKDTFKPRYTIYQTATTNPGGGSTFRMWSSGITDQTNGIEEIDVDMVVTNGATYMFDYNKTIRKIKKITVIASQVFTNWWRSCSNLEEVYFEDFGEEGDADYIKCEIGNDIDFSSCSDLKVASMKSVINHIVNGGFLVKFHENAWARLEASGPAPDGGTWKNYVQFTLGCSI